ncbi:carbohydrate esterase family 9 protein [Xylona heveae TC161]|uniref:Carbohydrate esterase family 9 protein n=1 Tax=Xylona heveae (strain CBS 132557 / TC161) TaxID=1328760 RepID=A0A165H0S3_XYLHT|nr:carbohydrate esterase family 9 protein [Xylona heveae TC161]KZF22842.1 carbohydrate esterase family 9 protein [Xylona heveae TC161]
MTTTLHSIATAPTAGVIKLTNCFLIKGDELAAEDLWISSRTGKILDGQDTFYGGQTLPDATVDLGGRIVSPGFIDVQLNGAFGFDFSVVPEDLEHYSQGVRRVGQGLIKTGVTSYLPTLTSQRSEVYHKTLRYLGPSGGARRAEDGSESLGAHCEGPFISPGKHGIHSRDVLLSAPRGFPDLVECYGKSNLGDAAPIRDNDDDPFAAPLPIKMITAAPEVGRIAAAIPEITSRNIIYSIGHSEATFEEATAAVEAGATMITHLFNAMRPLHHRNPGIFGVLGRKPEPASTNTTRPPYFGIIADGQHLHPTTVKIAYNAHPDGFILVTDATPLVGLPDGLYDATNGMRILKRGIAVTSEDSKTIAGSSITLIECATNFLNWTGSSLPQTIKTITLTPAKMLGLGNVKGTLESGADADLVVLRVVDAADGAVASTGIGEPDTSSSQDLGDKAPDTAGNGLGVPESQRQGRRKSESAIPGLGPTEEHRYTGRKIVLDQVWKFGRKVFDRADCKE